MPIQALRPAVHLRNVSLCETSQWQIRGTALCEIKTPPDQYKRTGVIATWSELRGARLRAAVQDAFIGKVVALGDELFLDKSQLDRKEDAFAEE
jgi:hypothetical protein